MHNKAKQHRCLSGAGPRYARPLLAALGNGITMKFENRRYPKSVRALGGVFSIALLILSGYNLIKPLNGFFDPKNPSLWVITAILMVTICGITFLLYKRRNFINSPPYEVKNGSLFIHYGGGEVDEYPLTNFNGKIETTKLLLEPYIKAPSYHRFQGKIPLGFVHKSERKKLLRYLRDRVENA